MFDINVSSYQNFAELAYVKSRSLGFGQPFGWKMRVFYHFHTAKSIRFLVIRVQTGVNFNFGNNRSNLQPLVWSMSVHFERTR